MSTELLPSPAAVRLYSFMSGISEDVYAAGWMTDCEWGIWAAYQLWKDGEPAIWSFADITSDMPELDRLHREAGGWVWWLDGKGAQFVTTDRWLWLLAERQRLNLHVTNEQLEIRSHAREGA